MIRIQICWQVQAWSFSRLTVKGKNLFKVDELGFITDTTSIIFYIKNRQLIKIDFHSVYNGKMLYAELFYDKGKLIDERRKGDLVFQFSYPALYDRAKKYLSYKPKLISQNWIQTSNSKSGSVFESR